MNSRSCDDTFGDYVIQTSAHGGECPYVSVIMPVYNGAATLERAIDSVISQVFPDFELILVNDGSTDDTGRIIEMAANADPRIVSISNERNIGLTRSLIRAIRSARGEIIARQDADDVSLPERFQRQLAWFPNYDFVCCRTLLDNGRISPRLPTIMLHRHMVRVKNVYIHGTFMFKKELYERVGGYDPDIRFAQDYDLVLRMAGQAGAKIKYLAQPLYISFKGPLCISRFNLKEQNACKRKIIEKNRRAMCR